MKTFQLFKSAFRNLHLYLRVCIIIKHEQVILITSKYFSKSFKLQKNRHLKSQLKPNYRPLNQQQPVIFAFLLRLAIGIISTSLKQSSVASYFQVILSHFKPIDSCLLCDKGCYNHKQLSSEVSKLRKLSRFSKFFGRPVDGCFYIVPSILLDNFIMKQK